MPVTIATLVSNVSVVEPDNLLSPELLDQIVRLVAARVLEQLREQQASRQLGHIPERNSNVDSVEQPFPS